MYFPEEEEVYEDPETRTYLGDFERAPPHKMLLENMPNISDLMTEYLGDDPVEKSKQSNISWMSSLTHFFEPTPVLKQVARGGYNEVSIYVTPYGKYGVRRYAIRRNISNYIASANRYRTDQIIQNIRHSMRIIQRASNEGLSPLVYYIGFANFSKGKTAVGILQISEAYEMDLHNYYADRVKRKFSAAQVSSGKWGPLDFDHNDSIISGQLIDLLSRMVTILHLTCFDVKPGNSVINVNNPDGPVVKLIDWDADYCEYTSASSKIDGRMADKIIMLHVILMANHFYLSFNHNILYEFVRDRINFENLSALSALFCGDQLSVGGPNALANYTRYQRQVISYFFKRMYIDIGKPSIWDSYLQSSIGDGLKQTSQLRYGAFIDLVKNAMRMNETDKTADYKFAELGILEKPLRSNARLTHYENLTSRHRKTAKKTTAKNKTAKKTSSSARRSSSAKKSSSARRSPSVRKSPSAKRSSSARRSR